MLDAPKMSSKSRKVKLTTFQLVIVEGTPSSIQSKSMVSSCLEPNASDMPAGFGHVPTATLKSGSVKDKQSALPDTVDYGKVKKIEVGWICAPCNVFNTPASKTCHGCQLPKYRGTQNASSSAQPESEDSMVKLKKSQVNIPEANSICWDTANSGAKPAAYGCGASEKISVIFECIGHASTQTAIIELKQAIKGLQMETTQIKEKLAILEDQHNPRNCCKIYEVSMQATEQSVSELETSIQSLESQNLSTDNIVLGKGLDTLMFKCTFAHETTLTTVANLQKTTEYLKKDIFTYKERLRNFTDAEQKFADGSNKFRAAKESTERVVVEFKQKLQNMEYESKLTQTTVSDCKIVLNSAFSNIIQGIEFVHRRLDE